VRANTKNNFRKKTRLYSRGAELKISSMMYWGSRYYLLTCALLVLPVYRFSIFTYGYYF